MEVVAGLSRTSPAHRTLPADRPTEGGTWLSQQQTPPSHQEGLRVAQGLLVDIPETGQLDAERESAAMSTLLADQWVSLSGKRRPTALQDYIEQSVSSRVYFDALGRIGEKLDDRGESIPPPARRVAGEGCRRAPAAVPP